MARGFFSAHLAQPRFVAADAIVCFYRNCDSAACLQYIANLVGNAGALSATGSICLNLGPNSDALEAVFDVFGAPQLPPAPVWQPQMNSSACLASA